VIEFGLKKSSRVQEESLRASYKSSRIDYEQSIKGDPTCSPLSLFYDFLQKYPINYQVQRGLLI